MDKIVYIPGLAEQLGLAVGTIHNQWRRKSHKFPPLTMLPGHSRPAWLQSDIDAWLAAHRRAAVPPARRPGRPKKSEQAARDLFLRDPRTVDFINGEADAEKGGAK